VIYGYTRISTDGQSLDAQRAELTAAGCAKVFSETASGARTDRPRLARALDALDPGDVLVVTRLDRLARSTRDLLNVLATIAKKGAEFRSLKDGWADTTTPHGRLMVTVLAGLAEFERELIVARTSEGRARPKARGVKLGPRFKLSAEQRAYVARERAKGESTRHHARILGVSRATIGRIPATTP
jgi:DNA invertase Pin-like site-specific DNA recombinase